MNNDKKTASNIKSKKAKEKCISIESVIGLLYALSEERGNEDCSIGDLTNLKLQKLLYYIQGFSLAKLDKPMFSNKILAWEHGPVVREVYNQFRYYIDNPIILPLKGYTTDEIDKAKPFHNLIIKVFKQYGKYSAWHLRDMTHDELPWKSTSRDQEISHQCMKEFFLNQKL